MNDEHIKEIVLKMNLAESLGLTPQFKIIPTASATLLNKIVMYTGNNTSDFVEGRLYKCIKIGTKQYKWIEIPDDEWQGVVDYPTYIYNQDADDNALAKKTGVCLRTDKVVVNQSCFGTSTNPPTRNLRKIYVEKGQRLGDTATSFTYFYWDECEPTQGAYDFDVIKDYIKTSYEMGMRTAIRIFVNTASQSDFDEANVYTVDGVDYRSHCPHYIVDMMIANNSPYFGLEGGKKYIHTDWNIPQLRARYIALVNAFAEWFYDDAEASFEVDGQTILCRDLVPYIEMGLMGQWGEGSRGSVSNGAIPFEYANKSSVEGMVNIYAAYFNAIDDKILCMGQIFEPYNQYNLQTQKVLEVALRVKELHNSMGYTGQYIDNVGADNRIYSDTYFIDANGTTLVSQFEYWGNRGDFFTGEFSAWLDPVRWLHGESGLFALKTFKLFKAPFFRLSNFTSIGFGDRNLVYNTDKKTYLDYVRALSCVGARFVLTPFSYKKALNQVNFVITNIGLSAPRFDFYDVKIRVRNLDGGVNDYVDITTSIDLTELEPKNEPLMYVPSNGYVQTVQIPTIEYTNYSISVIGIDKMGFTPMYFSNYDRSPDGSYLLFTVKGNTVTMVTQDLNTTEDKIDIALTNYVGNTGTDYFNANCDGYYHKSNSTWTHEFVNMAYDESAGDFEPYTPSSQYPYHTFSISCKSFDKLISGRYNNQPQDRKSIIFVNEKDEVILATNWPGQTSYGAEIVAPYGTVKAYYTCMNNGNTIANNRVFLMNGIIVPKGVGLAYTTMPDISPDFVSGMPITYKGVTSADFTKDVDYVCVASAVTPETGDNPVNLGWYENVNDKYVPTCDTTVVADRTYYKIEWSATQSTLVSLILASSDFADLQSRLQS